MGSKKGDLLKFVKTMKLVLFKIEENKFMKENLNIYQI